MRNKKIMSAVLASAICIASVVPYSERTQFFAIDTEKTNIGDVDGNNVIDAVDASAVLSDYSAVSTGGISLFDNIQQINADVNKDNSIDASDASCILAYYSYISTGGTLSLNEFLNSQEQREPIVTTTTTTATPVTKPRVVATQPATEVPVVQQIVEKNAVIRVETYDPEALPNTYQGVEASIAEGCERLYWMGYNRVVVTTNGWVSFNYTIPEAYMEDFMYVFNAERAQGSTPKGAVVRAGDYAGAVEAWGRDRVKYGDVTMLGGDGSLGGSWIWLYMPNEDIWKVVG